MSHRSVGRVPAFAIGATALGLVLGGGGLMSAGASGPGGPDGPNTLSGFSTSAFSADSYGTLFATFTVPSYGGCGYHITGGGLTLLSSYLRTVGQYEAQASIYPICSNGMVTSMTASVRVNSREGLSIPVSPGDTVKTTLTDHAPSGAKKGILSATVQDLTKGTETTVGSYPDSNPLIYMGIGQAVDPVKAYVNTFSTVHFSNVFFHGQPLGTTPGLTKSVIVNTNGKPLVAVSGPSPDGKAFTLLFRRNK